VRGSCFVQLSPNELFDSVAILEQFVVPQPNDSKAFVVKSSGARDVVRACISFRVLSPVELYNKPAIKANEVNNVPAERHLSAKLEIREAPPAEFRPKQTLSVGLVVTQ